MDRGCGRVGCGSNGLGFELLGDVFRQGRGLVTLYNLPHLLVHPLLQVLCAICQPVVVGVSREQVRHPQLLAKVLIGVVFLQKVAAGPKLRN